MTQSHVLNNGTPWSAIEVIAEFIMRDAEEVRQKATELGIYPKRKVLGEEAFN
jgi:hypothetical protein